MPADSDAGDLDDRLARLETAMRELENLQAELRSGQAGLKSGQRWLRWSGGSAAAVLGIVVAVLVAVVGLELQRSYSISDRLAEVQVETGKSATALEFVREDIAEIKSDIKLLRTDIQRVGEAVGAELEKTELAPNSSIQ